MGRGEAIGAARELIDSGAFFETLARRVAVPTASTETTVEVMHEYFDHQIAPDLEALGYTVEVFPNPAPDGFPFLVGRRVEDPSLPTVLTYGHADVVRGQADRWSAGQRQSFSRPRTQKPQALGLRSHLRRRTDSRDPVPTTGV